MKLWLWTDMKSRYDDDWCSTREARAIADAAEALYPIPAYINAATASVPSQPYVLRDLLSAQQIQWCRIIFRDMDVKRAGVINNQQRTLDTSRPMPCAHH